MRDRLRDAWSMLAVGLRIDRRLTTSLVALTVTTNVAMTLRALWFALLIDAVVSGASTAAMTWAVVLAASDSLRSWALVGSQLDRQDLNDRALQYFQEESMRLAGNLTGIEHHERPDYIDRISAYRASFPALSAALGNVVDVIANAARAVVTLALLATLNPVLVLLPIFAIASLLSARRAESIRQHANLAAMAPTRLGSHLYNLVTTAASAKEVKVFGIGAELRAREARLWHDTTNLQQTALRRAALVGTGGWLVFAAAYLGAIAFLVWRAASGAASAGDVLLGVVLAGQVNMQVATGVTLVGGLTQAAHSIAHRRWLIDYAADHQPNAPTQPCPEHLQVGIQLDAVSFTYPDSDASVLEDMTLVLPAGSVVALVGENGAGKTSLVKLLARFYKPTHGRILIDGTDLADLDPTEWRQRCAAGFQDFARYEFVAHETVGVGNLPDIDDRTAIANAVTRAGAADLPAALPDGLDTQLGALFDGIDVSGGQWQKLALGRAMMRPAPLLLLLDEPTAALDAPSEHDLFESYASQARATARATGAVTLLVSHRFSTVRSADLIVVIASGKVHEVGTHQALIAAEGLYAELYAIQARAYR